MLTLILQLLSLAKDCSKIKIFTMFIVLCEPPGSGVEDIVSFLINEFKFNLMSLDITNSCHSL